MHIICMIPFTTRVDNMYKASVGLGSIQQNMAYITQFSLHLQVSHLNSQELDISKFK
jgi:hypothetical protein